MAGVVVDIDKILKGKCLKKYMISKRGQVTIFIIIAIILIAAVALYFVFRDKISIDNIPSEIEPVYINIISCLEETIEEGVEYLVLHGGYYEVPKSISITYFTEDIPYYYLNSREYVPSVERVERELKNYIHNYLSNCLNFEDFEEQGYEIREGDLLVSVNIKEEEIRTKLDYPLTLTKGDSTKSLREFESIIEFNIPKFIETSQEIVSSYSEKPGFVCMTCLEEISEVQNVEIKATPVQDVSIFEENNIIWFSISDKEDYSIDKLNWMFIVEQ